jgi:hypothetical protein
MFCVSPRGDDRGDDIVRRCISGLSPGACKTLADGGERLRLDFSHPRDTSVLSIKVPSDESA